MLIKWKQKWYRRRFYQAAKKVLDTPPLELDEQPVRILSSVCHDDLYMYLVAVKSYFQHSPHGRVTILNDGTLTANDIRILEEHVKPTEIIPLDDVPYRGGRKGVRWGILLTMADLAERNFVVQLDSDTVTVARMPHVEEALESNRSFTLGTSMGQAIEAVARTVEAVRHSEGSHIQVLAEQNFDKLPNAESLRYVRGNSGLVGLAKNGFSRDQAEEFFENMTQILGERWFERGTFQVSSNFAVANSPNAFVLPLEEYRYFHPNEDLSKAKFIHYMGTYRFVGNSYYSDARRAVSELF